MELGTKCSSFPISDSKTGNNEHLLDRQIHIHPHTFLHVLIHLISHVRCGQPDNTKTF